MMYGVAYLTQSHTTTQKYQMSKANSTKTVQEISTALQSVTAELKSTVANHKTSITELQAQIDKLQSKVDDHNTELAKAQRIAMQIGINLEV